MLCLRLLTIAAWVAGAAVAAETDASSPKWPQWDGRESVADYATRANLPATKTIDLGGGVTLDMVLVPAGKFIMGTPAPDPVDEEAFHKKIVTGDTAAAIGGGVLLALVGAVLVQALRQRRRPQFSLARLLVMTIFAGVGVLGGMHAWYSKQALAKARLDHRTALLRFAEADPRTKPAHEVTLTRPFYLGKFEVTQKQYQQVTGKNPSVGKFASLPVDSVTWDGAQSFCKTAAEHAGCTLRLPSEAEWEFACRAGTTTTYYTGDSLFDLSRAGWHTRIAGSRTHPVGEKAPNNFGLYDMHGNVMEWCQDCYQPYKPDAKPDDEDDQDDPPTSSRVLRGGSWIH
ncbi:MAG TPA: SUMF1/EgtB/PvdO family nonheme iron enzyme [Planctomycetota bacterium]|jgi:hypothetical protein